MADQLSILKTKTASFCAYQERSSKQVEEKLSKLSATPQQAEKVIDWLIKENFLNESRFAEYYASGRFRLKKWGRIKIINGLRKHKVDDSLIQNAIKSLNQVEYHETLVQLIEKKRNSLNMDNPLQARKKIINYLIGKGFEMDLVLDKINQNR